jgi:hypothetical protein
VPGGCIRESYNISTVKPDKERYGRTRRYWEGNIATDVIETWSKSLNWTAKVKICSFKGINNYQLCKEDTILR